MLSGKNRSYLKGLAHSMDPVVYIGKEEVTENVMLELDRTLEARELIKVKLQDGCMLDPKRLANILAEELNAEFVQAIGRKFVLYRKSENKPKIELPYKK